MRITTAALPNRGTPALRCRRRFAGRMLTGRLFAAVLDGIDPFNVPENHCLNIAILFIVKHGRDSRAALVLFRLFRRFFFHRDFQLLLRSLDTMRSHVFFRQRRRSCFDDRLRNLRYRLRQRRLKLMRGSIREKVFGGIVNRLVVFFDCLDCFRLNRDGRLGCGGSLPVFSERLARQNERYNFFLSLSRFRCDFSRFSLFYSRLSCLRWRTGAPLLAAARSVFGIWKTAAVISAAAGASSTAFASIATAIVRSRFRRWRHCYARQRRYCGRSLHDSFARLGNWGSRLHCRGRTSLPITRLPISGFPSFARLTRLAWFTRLAQRALIARYLVEVFVLFQEIRHVEKRVAFQAQI